MSRGIAWACVFAAVLGLIGAAAPADGKTDNTSWTPCMCKGADKEHFWVDDKPLEKWCYASGHVEPDNTRTSGSNSSRSGALVFPVFGTTLPPDDDGNFGPYPLPAPLRLFGETKTEFWINTNGPVYFSPSFYPRIISPTSFKSLAKPVLAAFWSDVETGPCPGEDPDTSPSPTFPNCNNIVWRISTPTSSPSDLDLAKAFLGTATKPDYVLIITWNQVTPYPADSNTALNTFQVMVAAFGQKTTVAYFYEDIQWSRGSSALAGLASGTPGAAVVIAGSGLTPITQLVYTSGGTAQVAGLLPGQWVWDTVALPGCEAFGLGKLCGGTCIPAAECCATPNDCAFTTCPVTGCTCPLPAFDRIALQPHKADLACGQAARLTAKVTNGGTPVPGVQVTFRFSGDCLHPRYAVVDKTAVTDASGLASVDVTSGRPGHLEVVAAAATPGGAVRLSDTAHLAFDAHPRHGRDDDRHRWSTTYSDDEAALEGVIDLAAVTAEKV